MKIRISLVLVTFWLLLFSQVTTADSVLAQAFFGSFDFKNTVVYLSLEDEVSDGCLPNPAAIKDAWEVELRRLGFQLSEFKANSYGFMIFAVGHAANDYNCAVYIQSRVFSPRLWVPLPSGDAQTSSILLWSLGTMTTGAKTMMQNSIRDLARDHVNQFFLAVSQAKDSAQ